MTRRGWKKEIFGFALNLALIIWANKTVFICFYLDVLKSDKNRRRAIDACQLMWQIENEWCDDFETTAELRRAIDRKIQFEFSTFSFEHVERENRTKTKNMKKGKKEWRQVKNRRVIILNENQRQKNKQTCNQIKTIEANNRREMRRRRNIENSIIAFGQRSKSHAAKHLLGTILTDFDDFVSSNDEDEEKFPSKRKTIESNWRIRSQQPFQCKNDSFFSSFILCFNLEQIVYGLIDWHSNGSRSDVGREK